MKRLFKFLLGALFGASVAMLVTPKTGRQMREQLLSSTTGRLLPPGRESEPGPAQERAWEPVVVAEPPGEEPAVEGSGVVVEEARLTHLAYAPEIAQVMLRRQQAEAIIAARQKIVHGAVSMVQMALTELSEKQVVALDDERKAAMVSNLMTVLCAESEVQPVINTGTLYT